MEVDGDAVKLHKWADVRRSRLTPERDAKVQRRVRRTLKAMGAKKQTSDRVSRIAGRVLAQFEGVAAGTAVWNYWKGGRLTVGELRALAASCLSQDETKGKRRKVRK